MDDPLEAELSVIERFLSGEVRPQPEASASASARAVALEAPRAAAAAPMALQVSADALEARIEVIHPEDSVEVLVAGLRERDISCGILRDALVAAVGRARAHGPQSNVLAARGVPPRPATGPRADLRLPAGLRRAPDLGELVAALAGLVPLATLSGGRHWLVSAGTVLAEYVDEPGEVGVDLRGAVLPIPAAPPAEPLPEAGPGVRRDAATGAWVATLTGYAGWLDGCLTVVPPIRVIDQGSAANWVLLPGPPVAAPPTIPQLKRAAEAAGVWVGFDASGLEALRARLTEPGALVELPLALAEPPLPAIGLPPQLTFPRTLAAGARRADGTTDFKTRHLFPAVEAGQLLASCVPPRAGAPGRTVTGELVPIPRGQRFELVPALNARLEVDEDGAQRVYATVSGGVSLHVEQVRDANGPRACYRLQVQSVVEVGDVDYRTGHLDVEGNVQVDGDVRAGFVVKARGDVFVGGAVEAGARIEAEGEVHVEGAVVGPETRVRAGGDLRVGSAQSASLHSGGDVWVRRYVHDSVVNACGEVVVAGSDEERGGIVGGRTFAGRRIETRNAGSMWNRDTLLAAGAPDADTVARLRAAEVRGANAGQLLEQLLDKLEVKRLDGDSVRRLLQRSPDRAPLLARALEAARELAAAREEALEEAAEARDALRGAARRAAVEVEGRAHSGVTIRLGERAVCLRHDLVRVRFGLDANGKGEGVVWAPLAKPAKA